MYIGPWQEFALGRALQPTAGRRSGRRRVPVEAAPTDTELNVLVHTFKELASQLDHEGAKNMLRFSPLFMPTMQGLLNPMGGADVGPPVMSQHRALSNVAELQQAAALRAADSLLPPAAERRRGGAGGGTTVRGRRQKRVQQLQQMYSLGGGEAAGGRLGGAGGLGGGGAGGGEGGGGAGGGSLGGGGAGGGGIGGGGIGGGGAGGGGLGAGPARLRAAREILQRGKKALTA